MLYSSIIILTQRFGGAEFLDLTNPSGFKNLTGLIRGMLFEV